MNQFDFPPKLIASCSEAEIPKVPSSLLGVPPARGSVGSPSQQQHNFSCNSAAKCLTGGTCFFGHCSQPGFLWYLHSPGEGEKSKALHVTQVLEELPAKSAKFSVQYYNQLPALFLALTTYKQDFPVY